MQTFDPRKATFRLVSHKIVASLENFGCALIKRLFRPRELAPFDARITRNIASIEADAVAIGADGGFKAAGFPTYFAGNDDGDRVRAAFRRCYPGLFDTSQMDGLDCESFPRFVFQRLWETGLDRVLERYLGVARLSTSPGICHIRSFDAPAERDIARAEVGAEFHQDNRLYGLAREILTLWLPLRYQHGKMASLEFVPRAEKTLLPCKAIGSCGIERSLYPAEMFWRPNYQLGDAVIISGYSPHRTYYPQGVCMGRTSVDVRFFPVEQPRAIHAIEGARSKWHRLLAHYGPSL